MGKFVKGDVVVIPFPFSDLSQSKRRPALVLSVLPGNDLILCQITSQKVRDSLSIALDDSDFDSGSLKSPSNIRPNRIFTADEAIILYKVGTINPKKMDLVTKQLVEILNKY